MDLYRTAEELPFRLRGRLDLATPADLAIAGYSKAATHWRANRGALVRSQRGVYLRGRDPADLLAAIRAALSVCPPSTVIGFYTAAALLGFGVLPSHKVHVVVPAGTPFPQRSGIVAHQSVIPVGVPVEVLGVPCTPPARCAVDLARAHRRIDALPVLDAALHTGGCDVDALLAEVKAHDGLRGIRQVRDLVPLADGRPQCRQESQLRLILHDGGLQNFEPQHPVSDDDGRIRYYLDLADERSKVAAEYDGASHLDRFRLRADRVRHNWLEDLGWRMRYFTDRDLYAHAADIVDTVRRASRRRSA